MVRKSFRKISAVVICAAVALILVLPSVLGSRWIYQPLVDRLANERFDLEIDQVKLGWFQPLSFHVIRLQPRGLVSAAPTAQPAFELAGEPAELANVEESIRRQQDTTQPLLSIRTIQSNRSLLGFLLGGRDLGQLEVVDPNIDIRLLQEGSNLERLIRAVIASSPTKRDNLDSRSPPARNQQAKPKFDVKIVIRGLHVTVADHQAQQLFVIPPFDATVAYIGRADRPQVVVEPAKVLD